MSGLAVRGGVPVGLTRPIVDLGTLLQKVLWIWASVVSVLIKGEMFSKVVEQKQFWIICNENRFWCRTNISPIRSLERADDLHRHTPANVSTPGLKQQVVGQRLFTLFTKDQMFHFDREQTQHQWQLQLVRSQLQWHISVRHGAECRLLLQNVLTLPGLGCIK